MSETHAAYPIHDIRSWRTLGLCGLGVTIALALSVHFLILSAKAEEPRETLLPALVISGTIDEGLYVYGQIDKGVLLYDDGSSRTTYPFVDNSNASTRFGARLNGVIASELRFSTNLEFEWTPYATKHVNERNKDDIDSSTKELRKAEGVLNSSKYGRLWLGQGSMASDGTAESDLSGTSVVA